MKTIILYGDLRKQFGKEFRLNVKTAGEAIRALCKLVAGFEDYLVKNSSPGYHIKLGKQYLSNDELYEPSGSKDVLRISPYIAGSGGALKVIVGIALVAVALSNPAGLTLAGFTLSQSAMLSFGVSLVLGGISEILFSPPKPPSSQSRERDARPSYAFDGPENTVEQGNPVPICYGELMVGSQVISAVTYAKDI